ncbi:S-phase delaying protein 1 [Elsinoe australis]|uniref:Choline monooxygenase, chloroplastic n=1 Tax=Elsinoe australis TaxID=40998 RepID=A0A2P7YNF8_9PEZI|nr:S-phase delaying protein 1 [Elsinoe australis]
MAPKSRSAGPVCSSPYTAGKTEPVRAVSASWYTSEDMYQLQRRAIFSKKWMLITHEVRFPNAGDWIKFEITGYEYVVSKDRKGNFHAWHNNCRHRGYPIVDANSGRNQILSCKYHGWSYSMDGRLKKAPWYDNVTDFNKSENSLFSSHVRKDALGFIWVNLDSSDTPEPWEKEFDGIDTQNRYDGYDMNVYVFDHEFEIDAATNWKLCSDNFNECYHCPTSHPTIPALFDIDTLTSDAKDGYVILASAQDEQQKKEGLQICTTYCFPNVSTNILPNYIMLQRFLPINAHRTKMHYQIFRNKNANQEHFDKINVLYKQVMSEDKGLACGVQKNMELGHFVNGQMHPQIESPVVHQQAKTREAVKEHAALEKSAGRSIWPVAQAPNSDMVTF